MGYYEGNLELGCNNGNGGMFGNNGDWIWAFLLFALIGNNGWGGAGYGGGRGNCATQADLANGFAQNTLQRGIDDIILGQAQMQNFINQGFNGINATVTNGFAGVNNAICTLGYQNQAGVNALATQIAQCCCDTRSAISDLKYANERQTCDIVNASNANTRAILDYLTGEKIASLQAENSGLKAQISNDKQSAYIVSQLKEPCAIPSYLVPNPHCCYNPCGCASVQ